MWGASHTNNVGDSWLLLDDSGLKSTATGSHEIARDLKTISFKQLSNRRKMEVAKRIGDNFSVNKMINAYLSLYNLTDELV